MGVLLSGNTEVLALGKDALVVTPVIATLTIVEGGFLPLPKLLGIVFVKEIRLGPLELSVLTEDVAPVVVPLSNVALGATPLLLTLISLRESVTLDRNKPLMGILRVAEILLNV